MPTFRRTHSRAAAGAVLAGILLSGCAQLPAILGQLSLGQPEAKSTLVEPTSEVFARFGIKADNSEMVSSGILAKNSSKFSGSVTVPPGILAKNSSKYRVASYVEEPLPNADVMLLSPRGQYLVMDGKYALTKTDEKGHYDFGDFRFPPGRKIWVRVLGPTGPGFETFRYANEGANVFDVSLASTVVTRFALSQGFLTGKTLGDFDAERFVGIEGATRALLESGELLVSRDDYLLSKPAVLAYQAAMKRGDGELLRRWREFLGFEPVEVKPDPPAPASETELKHEDSINLGGSD